MSASLTGLRRALDGVALPLKATAFRRIWSASLFANLGQQVQLVAAAWAMVELAVPSNFVALIQTAAMLPVMLLALPAGAFADLHDRRRVAIAGLLICASGAALLFTLALIGRLTPHWLLCGCFVSGIGFALLSPAWQSSVREQVGSEALPAAIALYAVSANLARCAGPAVGGVIVAGLGISTAFGINVVMYLPMILALSFWRREQVAQLGSDASVYGAIHMGVLYMARSPPVRRIVFRALLSAVGSIAILSLAPLVASEQLRVGAGVFGLLLAGFGAGAAASIFLVGPIRQRWTPQLIIGVCGGVLAAALLTVAFSHSILLSSSAMALAGAGWMLSMSIFNLGVQLSAAPWVTGRMLAMFSASVACGMAGGAWAWGTLAARFGLMRALFVAALFVLATLVIGLAVPLPTTEVSHSGQKL